jgi:DNA polymerase III epsilon subunit-like protein
MTDNKRLAFLDFEASSLRGFPIEAGLAVFDSEEVRSWLIKPTEEWLGRTRVGDPSRTAPLLWDPEAEKLHGISIEQLQAEGLPSRQVAAELMNMLGGRRILSDAPRYEQAWLDQLVAVLDAPIVVPRVENARHFFAREIGSPKLYELAENMVFDRREKEGWPRHRAAWDAQYLLEIARTIGALKSNPTWLEPKS